MRYLSFILLLLLFSCKQSETKEATTILPWVSYDESKELAESAKHQSRRMRYKLIQSKVLDKNDIWNTIAPQIADFSEDDYNVLKPLILEQDIPTIQSHIQSGKLTYKILTQWYLYRIVKFENNQETYLNAIISINPEAVSEAEKKDANTSNNNHPIFGMPILLKDNINTQGMYTTAGAHILKNNSTPDAYITERIKEKGGIILGKANLSEWANYLTLGGPNGYSAIGGQTLNPYGRKIFDTGGSSSGSGSSMAVNYAVAAVGTETSGSILSPSSKHSLIGLKPTTGLLSRSGIVPLSSTVDTPGPMTRTVIDNAILLSAMTGEDPTDPATKDNPKNIEYWSDLKESSLSGIRFGVNKRLTTDSTYMLVVEKIVALGGIAIEFEFPEINSEGFTSLLRVDMNNDLAKYIDAYLPKGFKHRSVADIIAYNKQDSTLRIPYGQGRLEGILTEHVSDEEMITLRKQLKAEGLKYFETPMKEHDLDVVLSINNFNARNAAMANYPCLTMPMGYSDAGEPIGLTFMAPSYMESKLLKIAYALEQEYQKRETPKLYN
ncbi:amidase [Flavobacteriaceae bacterium AU392]|nr:amidase [Flavobacteriaceae bacterium]RKM85668.1 amidase [Flavobacteriaceae bacterium AU392]